MEGKTQETAAAQGWDERAFSAQVAEWAIAVAGETGASVAHPAPTPSTGCGRMRLSRCCGMIRLAS